MSSLPVGSSSSSSAASASASSSSLAPRPAHSALLLTPPNPSRSPPLASSVIPRPSPAHSNSLSASPLRPFRPLLSPPVPPSSSLPHTLASLLSPVPSQSSSAQYDRSPPHPSLHPSSAQAAHLSQSNSLLPTPIDARLPHRLSIPPSRRSRPSSAQDLAALSPSLGSSASLSPQLSRNGPPPFSDYPPATHPPILLNPASDTCPPTAPSRPLALNGSCLPQEEGQARRLISPALGHSTQFASHLPPSTGPSRPYSRPHPSDRPERHAAHRRSPPGLLPHPSRPLEEAAWRNRSHSHLSYRHPSDRPPSTEHHFVHPLPKRPLGSAEWVSAHHHHHHHHHHHRPQSSIHHPPSAHSLPPPRHPTHHQHQPLLDGHTSLPCQQPASSSSSKSAGRLAEPSSAHPQPPRLYHPEPRHILSHSPPDPSSLHSGPRLRSVELLANHHSLHQTQNTPIPHRFHLSRHRSQALDLTPPAGSSLSEEHHSARSQRPPPALRTTTNHPHPPLHLLNSSPLTHNHLPPPPPPGTCCYSPTTDSALAQFPPWHHDNSCPSSSNAQSQSGPNHLTRTTHQHHPLHLTPVDPHSPFTSHRSSLSLSDPCPQQAIIPPSVPRHSFNPESHPSPSPKNHHHVAPTQHCSSHSPRNLSQPSSPSSLGSFLPLPPSANQELHSHSLHHPRAHSQHPASQPPSSPPLSHFSQIHPPQSNEVSVYPSEPIQRHLQSPLHPQPSLTVHEDLTEHQKHSPFPPSPSPTQMSSRVLQPFLTPLGSDNPRPSSGADAQTQAQAHTQIPTHASRGSASHVPKEDATDSQTDDGIIRCICSVTTDDGFTIQCETCEVWQHTVCVSVPIDEVPEHYFCDRCDPSPVRRKQLAEMAPRAELIQQLRLKREAQAQALDSENSVRNFQPLSPVDDLSPKSDDPDGVTVDSHLISTALSRVSSGAQLSDQPRVNRTSLSPLIQNLGPKSLERPNTALPEPNQPLRARKPQKRFSVSAWPSTAAVDHDPAVRNDALVENGLGLSGLLDGPLNLDPTHPTTDLNTILPRDGPPRKPGRKNNKSSITKSAVLKPSSELLSTLSCTVATESDNNLSLAVDSDDRYESWRYEYTPTLRDIYTDNSVKNLIERLITQYMSNHHSPQLVEEEKARGWANDEECGAAAPGSEQLGDSAVKRAPKTPHPSATDSSISPVPPPLTPTPTVPITGEAMDTTVITPFRAFGSARFQPVTMPELPAPLRLTVKAIPPSSINFAPSLHTNPFCPTFSASSHNPTASLLPRLITHGVFSAQPISRGSFIASLKGSITSLSRYTQDIINQYDSLGCNKPYVKFFKSTQPDSCMVNDGASELQDGLVIDSRQYGNEMRFVRNGCHPNAFINIIVTPHSNSNNTCKGPASEEERPMDPDGEMSARLETIEGVSLSDPPVNLHQPTLPHYLPDKMGGGRGIGQVDDHVGGPVENCLHLPWDVSFGVFAASDISRREEIILPWDWDDQHFVHLLPRLLFHSNVFEAQQQQKSPSLPSLRTRFLPWSAVDLQLLSCKMASIALTLFGLTFCGCEKKRSCAVNLMWKIGCLSAGLPLFRHQSVQDSQTFAGDEPSELVPMSRLKEKHDANEPLSFEDKLRIVLNSFLEQPNQNSSKSGRGPSYNFNITSANRIKKHKIDLGPLLGLKRDWWLATLPEHAVHECGSSMILNRRTTTGQRKLKRHRSASGNLNHALNKVRKTSGGVVIPCVIERAQSSQPDEDSTLLLPPLAGKQHDVDDEMSSNGPSRPRGDAEESMAEEIIGKETGPHTIQPSGHPFVRALQHGTLTRERQLGDPVNGSVPMSLMPLPMDAVKSIRSVLDKHISTIPPPNSSLVDHHPSKSFRSTASHTSEGPLELQQRPSKVPHHADDPRPAPEPDGLSTGLPEHKSMALKGVVSGGDDVMVKATSPRASSPQETSLAAGDRLLGPAPEPFHPCGQINAAVLEQSKLVEDTFRDRVQSLPAGSSGAVKTENPPMTKLTPKPVKTNSLTKSLSLLIGSTQSEPLNSGVLEPKMSITDSQPGCVLLARDNGLGPGRGRIRGGSSGGGIDSSGSDRGNASSSRSGGSSSSSSSSSFSIRKRRRRRRRRRRGRRSSGCRILPPEAHSLPESAVVGGVRTSSNLITASNDLVPSTCPPPSDTMLVGPANLASQVSICGGSPDPKGRGDDGPAINSKTPEATLGIEATARGDPPHYEGGGDSPSGQDQALKDLTADRDTVMIANHDVVNMVPSSEQRRVISNQVHSPSSGEEGVQVLVSMDPTLHGSSLTVPKPSYGEKCNVTLELNPSPVETDSRIRAGSGQRPGAPQSAGFAGPEEPIGLCTSRRVSAAVVEPLLPTESVVFPTDGSDEDDEGEMFLSEGSEATDEEMLDSDASTTILDSSDEEMLSSHTNRYLVHRKKNKGKQQLKLARLGSAGKGSLSPVAEKPNHRFGSEGGKGEPRAHGKVVKAAVLDRASITSRARRVRDTSSSLESAGMEGDIVDLTGNPNHVHQKEPGTTKLKRIIKSSSPSEVDPAETESVERRSSFNISTTRPSPLGRHADLPTRGTVDSDCLPAITPLATFGGEDLQGAKSPPALTCHSNFVPSSAPAGQHHGHQDLGADHQTTAQGFQSHHTEVPSSVQVQPANRADITLASQDIRPPLIIDHVEQDVAMSSPRVVSQDSEPSVVKAAAPKRISLKDYRSRKINHEPAATVPVINPLIRFSAPQVLKTSAEVERTTTKAATPPPVLPSLPPLLPSATQALPLLPLSPRKLELVSSVLNKKEERLSSKEERDAIGHGKAEEKSLEKGVSLEGSPKPVSCEPFLVVKCDSPVQGRASNCEPESTVAMPEAVVGDKQLSGEMVPRDPKYSQLHHPSQHPGVPSGDAPLTVWGAKEVEGRVVWLSQDEQYLQEDIDGVAIECTSTPSGYDDLEEDEVRGEEVDEVRSTDASPKLGGGVASCLAEVPIKQAEKTELDVVGGEEALKVAHLHSDQGLLSGPTTRRSILTCVQEGVSINGKLPADQLAAAGSSSGGDSSSIVDADSQGPPPVHARGSSHDSARMCSKPPSPPWQSRSPRDFTEPSRTVLGVRGEEAKSQKMETEPDCSPVTGLQSLPARPRLSLAAYRQRLAATRPLAADDAPHQSASRPSAFSSPASDASKAANGQLAPGHFRTSADVSGPNLDLTHLGKGPEGKRSTPSADSRVGMVAHDAACNSLGSRHQSVALRPTYSSLDEGLDKEEPDRCEGRGDSGSQEQPQETTLYFPPISPSILMGDKSPRSSPRSAHSPSSVDDGNRTFEDKLKPVTCSVAQLQLSSSSGPSSAQKSPCANHPRDAEQRFTSGSLPTMSPLNKPGEKLVATEASHQSLEQKLPSVVAGNNSPNSALHNDNPDVKIGPLDSGTDVPFRCTATQSALPPFALAALHRASNSSLNQCAGLNASRSPRPPAAAPLHTSTTPNNSSTSPQVNLAPATSSPSVAHHLLTYRSSSPTPSILPNNLTSAPLANLHDSGSHLDNTRANGRTLAATSVVGLGRPTVPPPRSGRTAAPHTPCSQPPSTSRASWPPATTSCSTTAKSFAGAGLAPNTLGKSTRADSISTRLPPACASASLGLPSSMHNPGVSSLPKPPINNDSPLPVQMPRATSSFHGGTGRSGVGYATDYRASGTPVGVTGPGPPGSSRSPVVGERARYEGLARAPIDVHSPPPYFSRGRAKIKGSVHHWSASDRGSRNGHSR